MEFFLILKEIYLVFLLSSLVLTVLTVGLFFSIQKHKFRCKKLSKEISAEKEKNDRLTVHIETLRGEIETVRAIAESTGDRPVRFSQEVDSEPLGAPLLLDEVINPDIFESTIDGSRIEIRSAAVLPGQPDENSYNVEFDPQKKDWIIRKFGQSRVLRRVPTKEEAVKLAKELARNRGAAVVVHKKDRQPKEL